MFSNPPDLDFCLFSTFSRFSSVTKKTFRQDYAFYPKSVLYAQRNSPKPLSKAKLFKKQTLPDKMATDQRLSFRVFRNPKGECHFEMFIYIDVIKTTNQLHCFGCVDHPIALSFSTTTL